MTFKKEIENDKNIEDSTPLINDDNQEETVVMDESEGDNLASIQKIRDLKDKLKNCEKERMEYLSGWQRSKADFINSKKEIAAEQNNFISFAEGALIKDLLPVLSSFSAAMADKKVWEEVSSNWRKGVEYIHNQLIGVLSSRGLETKEPINELFDPLFHEAVGEENVSEIEMDHKIIKVLSPLFLQKGKVVQPAKVIVGIYFKKQEVSVP